MQRLEVSGAVRPIYRSLGVKRLNTEILILNYIRKLQMSEKSNGNMKHEASLS